MASKIFKRITAVRDKFFALPVLDRATLVAQWCAPIALVVAGAGWHEARLARTEAKEVAQHALEETRREASNALEEAKLAREEQEKFFVFEKSPDVKVKRAWLSEGGERGLFEVEFENSGQSMATDLVLRVGLVVPGDKYLHPLVSKKLGPLHIDIKNGKTAAVPVLTVQELADAIRFPPSEIVNHDPQLMNSGNGSAWLRVFYSFLDVQNHVNEGSALIEVLNKS
jgi:hypothetical protein